jgi:hypothetical protein
MILPNRLTTTRSTITRQRRNGRASLRVCSKVSNAVLDPLYALAGPLGIRPFGSSLADLLTASGSQEAQ